MATSIASPALVTVGVLMVVLGLFGGPEYVVMAMSLISLIAAAVIGIVERRAIRA